MCQLFPDKLFITTPLNNLLQKVFIFFVTQIIIASAGVHKGKCNRKNAVTALRVQEKSDKYLKGTHLLGDFLQKTEVFSKFIRKNQWYSPFSIKLKPATLLKKSCIWLLRNFWRKSFDEHLWTSASEGIA